ncbi:MAG: hypothetical protein JNM18_25165 [Planctomycetaceae bacterium]|nr:hypothetical protein [Planctomycetaceae bacterium]
MSRLTVESYAAQKRLPPSLLQDLRVRNYGGGILIPYASRNDGVPVRSRHRLVNEKGRRAFRWLTPKGKAKQATTAPYGIGWQFNGELALPTGTLLLVEGESDTQTAALHDVRALGIPGAAMAACLNLIDLAGTDHVIIIREPGKGGETFVEQLAHRLGAIAFTGKVSFITLPAKDLNELHCKLYAEHGADACRDPFLAALRAAIDAATPLPIKHAAKRERKPPPVAVDVGRVDLRSLITGELGEADRDGRWLCPFHDDAKPSLSTFTGRDRKERFKCHSCGAKGDAIEWVTKRKGLSFNQAAELLGLIEAEPVKVNIRRAEQATMAGKSDEQAEVELKRDQELDAMAERGEYPPGHQLITNCDIAAIVGVDANGKPKQQPPLRLELLDQEIAKITRRWPRSCSGLLFAVEKGEPVFLDSADSLFGWLHKFGPVEWHGGVGYVPKREYFQHVRRTARLYAAIERTPHEPQMENRFYLCDMPKVDGEGSRIGERLGELLDMFCPLTPADRELILAMFATAIWGGPAGSRPCFVISAPSGRGAGKTSLSQAVSQLVGGHFAVSPGEPFDQLMHRLLSPAAMSTRIGLIDNLKAAKWSWGQLEGLITASRISGKRLWAGEGWRENTMLWIVTANSPQFSADIASRSVEIRLAEPVRQSGWNERLSCFIESYRSEIIADLVRFLRSPKQDTGKLSRWASFDGEVIARLADPAGVMRIIEDRRKVSDVEVDEASLIQTLVRDKLEDLHCDTDSCHIFIPSSVMAGWVSEAIGERLSVVAACRRLSQGIDEGKICQLCQMRDTRGRRGFKFFGDIGDDTEAVTLYDLGERIANRFRA